MKAWRIIEKGHPSTNLTQQNITLPEPNAQQVRIKVEAAVINFADILVCQGIYQNRPETPFTPGLEAAGTVTAVGQGSVYAVGDHVAGMTALPDGSFAEHCLINDSAVLKYPDNIAFADSGILYNTFLTAHIALFRRAQLAAGETLLVLAGAGGVGSAAIQLGCAAGATVIAAASSSEKLDYCKKLGAHHVINYRDEDLYSRLGEITNNAGIDVCFDPVGGAMAVPVRRRLAFEGRYVIIGFTAGEIPSFPANHALVKHYSVIGSAWTEYLNKNKSVVEEAFQAILKLFDAERIKIGKWDSINFDGLPQALSDIENRKTIGRLILSPDG